MRRDPAPLVDVLRGHLEAAVGELARDLGGPTGFTHCLGARILWGHSKHLDLFDRWHARSINRRLMIVNPQLLDAPKTGRETQPMVDKNKTESFAARFERLRGGMSYEALSEAIKRKTGVQISAQAMHKWSRGGNIDQKNIKPVCEFFGVEESWLMYGTGQESKLSLDELVNALPEAEREKTVDFIRYQVERSATETHLFAEDPARLTEYLKFIDRLIQNRRTKK